MGGSTRDRGVTHIVHPGGCEKRENERKKENGPAVDEKEALHEALLQAEPVLGAGAVSCSLVELQVWRDDITKYCFEGAVYVLRFVFLMIFSVVFKNKILFCYSFSACLVFFVS